MSSTEFEIGIFKELISNFYKIKKRILQNRPISSRKSKVEEYIDSLITSYNNILAYTSPFIEQIPQSLKQEIFSKITHCRELLFKCFCKLNCRIRVPYGAYLFEKIQRNITTVSESENDV